MSRLEQTQKLIKHSSLMNPDKDHHEHQHSDEEHSNILMMDINPNNTHAAITSVAILNNLIELSKPRDTLLLTLAVKTSIMTKRRGIL